MRFVNSRLSAWRGGSYVCRPRVSREDVSNRMLGDVVERVFDGSAAAVALNLLDTSDITREELGELRKRIQDRMKERAR
jgi:BlaI family penicillinase repressor